MQSIMTSLELLYEPQQLSVIRQRQKDTAAISAFSASPELEKTEQETLPGALFECNLNLFHQQNPPHGLIGEGVLILHLHWNGLCFLPVEQCWGC